MKTLERTVGVEHDGATNALRTQAFGSHGSKHSLIEIDAKDCEILSPPVYRRSSGSVAVEVELEVGAA